MIPRRIKRQEGRHSLVDGIPFHLPVNSEKTPALMAAFPIDAEKAAKLLPGNEVHPLRVWNRGLLVVTVVDYKVTDIGKYIEFSIAIACTRGKRPAPRLVPLLLPKLYGMGQYVVDLPVSTEVSVKGGKGIWGMPKHQANLDFVVGEEVVSSQYDLDGRLAMKIEIDRPKRAWLPVSMGAANYCAFRGLLMKSYIYFKGKLGFSFFKKGSARLYLGDHPRVQALKDLEIGANPMFTAFFPQTRGVLDDYFESWFLTYDAPPTKKPEGLETVVGLGLGQEWLDPPKAPVPPPVERKAARRPAALRSRLLSWNHALLFLCVSMYLGTGWSLLLFSFPVAPQLTPDNYYLQFVPQVQAATQFFTYMTMAMIAFALVMLVAEWRGPLRWVPIVVLLGVVAATGLTMVYIFPLNQTMSAGITDPAILGDVLDRWMNLNRVRVGLWTVQWLAMMAYFVGKQRAAGRIRSSVPAPGGRA